MGTQPTTFDSWRARHAGGLMVKDAPAGNGLRNDATERNPRRGIMSTRPMFIVSWQARLTGGLLAVVIAALFAFPSLAQQVPGVGEVGVAFSDGSLTATWPAVEGATHYHVTYSADNGKTWSPAFLNYGLTSITIDNIDAGKAYIVATRAGNANGWSGWTQSVLPAP